MGKFITAEGGEFVGKTFLIDAITQVVKEAGIDPVRKTREPGGSEEAEKIREKIFNRLREGAGAEELIVYFNEGRQIHLMRTVWPQIGIRKEKKGLVLCDRYVDTTQVLLLFGSDVSDHICLLRKVSSNT